MTAGVEVLMVPGFTGSGPHHWQSLWQRDDPAFRRVEQRDWDRPEPREWTRALEDGIRQTASRLLLVGHSLGCITIVRWARDYRAAGVAAALLVAPSDVEAESAPLEVRGFAPIPLEPLPFRSVVVASDDDPLVTPQRARRFAGAWGAEFVSVGDCGHLNTASGHGPWPQGRVLLARLLADLR